MTQTYDRPIMEIEHETGTTRVPLISATYYPRPSPRVVYSDGDTEREIPIEEPTTLVEDKLTAVTSPNRYDLTIRGLDEGDTYILAPGRTAPMPLSVLRTIDEVTRVPDVFALIDDDGDVFTLALFAPEQIYVRFDGAWQGVADPMMITEYDAVKVEDSAVDIFDAADTQGQEINATSLPTAEGELPYQGPSERTAVSDDQTTPDSLTAAYFAALPYPIISSAEELTNAIALAETNPEMQWYVEKRAKALGLDVPLPWKA